MDALPAVLAGVMFYPLTRHLRRRVRQALPGAVDPRRHLHAGGVATAQSDVADPFGPARARHEPAVALGCAGGRLLALGYVTKFSEDFSRRVVVTWVLVTPVLLVMLSLVLQSMTRALLRGRRPGAPRGHRRSPRRAWSSRGGWRCTSSSVSRWRASSTIAAATGSAVRKPRSCSAASTTSRPS